MIFHLILLRYLSEDLEHIQKHAVRIILPDYKYCDALKIVNIDTLYDRCESLSSKLFNEISHTSDHKLACLLPARSKCRKLRNNRNLIFQFTKHIVTRSLLLLAIFTELVYSQVPIEEPTWFSELASKQALICSYWQIYSAFYY